MKKISELRGILGQYLIWNKARLECFAQMLVALFVTRTVNLKRKKRGQGRKGVSQGRKGVIKEEKGSGLRFRDSYLT